jgi:ribonucleoside-diphosphate reductase alpha chain
MIGVAEYFAKRGIRYDSAYGLEVAHQMAERHLYFLIKAALRLGKELGNAPWIHKTRWADGIFPIDTYKKNVDKITPHKLRYDWETLRAEVIANKGIRFSSLVGHMPAESSSKSSGSPNGLYPIRELDMKKKINYSLL